MTVPCGKAIELMHWRGIRRTKVYGAQSQLISESEGVTERLQACIQLSDDVGLEGWGCGGKGDYCAYRHLIPTDSVIRGR